MIFPKAKTFPGGTHPPDSKRLTNFSLIEVLPPPDEVCINLSQHIGAPAKPLVARGDTVTVGQRIGEASGFISAHVHASVNGEVTAVEDRPGIMGFPVPSVVIRKTDDQGFSNTDSGKGIADFSPEELIEKVKEAGIVGMGGATFPTHVKLSPPPEKHIDTFILNSAECEPYLTSDHRLMIERTNEVMGGIRYIRKMLGVSRTCIGVEQNKPDVIKAFTHITEGNDDIEVVPLKMKYPQGGEKQLIKAVTGREVPSGKLPMDVGCLVQNVGTVVAVFEAITYGKPLIERVVTVTGEIVREPKNILARIGTPVSELIACCGGLTEPAAKLVCGGPMMGLAQGTLDISVVKGMSGLLFMSAGQVDENGESRCISCGECVDVCPMHLVPTILAKKIRHEQFQEAVTDGLPDCMECGSCAYVCPAKIRLVHYFKWGKAEAARIAKKVS